jgi:hypothetical protein
MHRRRAFVLTCIVLLYLHSHDGVHVIRARRAAVGLWTTAFSMLTWQISWILWLVLWVGVVFGVGLKRVHACCALILWYYGYPVVNPSSSNVVVKRGCLLWVIRCLSFVSFCFLSVSPFCPFVCLCVRLSVCLSKLQL